MVEKLTFDFEEEEEFGPEGEDDFPDPMEPEDRGPGKGKSSRTRLMLLFLLLLVVGAAGYYFLVMMPGSSAPPARPVPPAKKQPIAMPLPPKPASPSAVSLPPSGTTPASSVSPMNSTPVSPASPEPVKEVVMGQQQPAAVGQGPAATAPVVPKPTASPTPGPAKPQAVTAAPVTPSSKSAASPSPAQESSAAVTRPAPPLSVGKDAKPASSAPLRGEYSLLGGAFLLDSNLQEAEKVIRKLGFEPRRKEIKSKVTMTRLRAGAFPFREGKAKLQELKKEAPDAFYLMNGDQMVIYLGSFFDLDKARRFADLLYEDGIRVEEEQVAVPATLTQLVFGDFANSDQAARAADKARRAGLDVLVIKNR